MSDENKDDLSRVEPGAPTTGSTAQIANGSSRRNDGGQAFPVPAGNFTGGESWSSEEGMTLRDYFAAQLLAGVFSGGDTDWDEDLMAKRAYTMADAMLAARGAS